MEKVVISLGGSIIIPDIQDGEFLHKFASILSRASKDYDIFVVCGGGKVARYYIVTGRELGTSEDDLDRLGIDVTRLNARLLQLALKDMSTEPIPHTVEAAASLGGKGKIVVMGGTTPGHTTDGVSAALAEAIGASRIVNATSVDGVYTADPKRVKDAKKYDRITFDQLHGMLSNTKHGAGNSGVFDPMGAKIVLRAKIPIYVVDGRNLEEMERAIKGEEISGTIIKD